VESFKVHVTDEVLDDLRARLRRTRWPDEVSGIGWKQGTNLDWLQHLVSYWANDFDWRAWEQRLGALDQFTWDGIHFVYKRAASGRGVPIVLTHGWPSSFLDYLDMLPMLENFDVVVPSLPGYGFSTRPARSESTTGMSRKFGTGSCLRLGIPGTAQAAMTLGPESRRSWRWTILSR